MKSLSVLLITLFLTGCAAISGNSPILRGGNVPIDFTSIDYNDINNQYMERMTAVTINELSNGDKMLHIGSDSYGYNHGFVMLLKSSTDTYLSFIDKYLDWESKARQSGHIVDKQIGVADGYTTDATFHFFSGNKYDHYLLVNGCGSYCGIGMTLMFDRESAVKLRELILRFKNDQIPLIDTDSIYQ